MGGFSPWMFPQMFKGMGMEGKGGKGMMGMPWMGMGMMGMPGMWGEGANGMWNGKGEGGGKHHKDRRRSHSRNRSRGSRSRSRSGSLEHDTVKLARKLMGRVIGRQGAIIKGIRDESGARIDAEDLDDDQCEFRLVGSAEAVKRAKEMIIEVAEKASSADAGGGKGNAGGGDSSTTGDLSDTLEFPVQVTGGIIGSKGANIADVRAQSGAKVSIDKLEDRCKVLISGTAEQIARARVMVLRLAENNKDGSRPNGQDDQVEQYGKDDDDEETRTTEGTVSETLEFPPGATGGIIGSRGAKIGEVRQRSGAKISVEKLEECCRVKIIGLPEQVEKAKELVTSLADEDKMHQAAAAGGGGDVVADSLEFPMQVTGGIIGSKGAHINDVRHKSGAKVSVEKLEDRCKVLISGLPDQVARAKSMICRLAEEDRSSSGDVVEDNMEVPQSMVGRVIGKGGETVQRLQRDSGARIDVNGNAGDPCPIRIRGSHACVANARWLIMDLLHRGADGVGSSQWDSYGGGGDGACPWGFPGSDMDSAHWGSQWQAAAAAMWPQQLALGGGGMGGGAAMWPEYGPPSQSGRDDRRSNDKSSRRRDREAQSPKGSRELKTDRGGRSEALLIDLEEL